MTQEQNLLTEKSINNELNGNSKCVIQHLIENSEWIVSPTLQKALRHKRVSYYLDNDFQFRLGRCDLDMSWMEPPLKKTKKWRMCHFFL